MNDSVVFLTFLFWNHEHLSILKLVQCFYVVGVVTDFMYLSYNAKCMVLESCDKHMFAGRIKM